MMIPLEITYRNVEKTSEIDQLIRDKAAKLSEIHSSIISCRVIVEKLQRHQTTGLPYRVRIDIKLPPGHELVVNRDHSKSDLHLELEAEIRNAFEAAERQILGLKGKQQGDVKRHPAQEVQGVIEKIFVLEENGFIRTLDGRQVFFTKHSLIHDSFESLKIGLGVRFSEEMGKKGPQASSVKVIDRPESY
jgi:cold shock CspA family protein/ribosome-associated translation inhibitor RaiA